VRSSAEPAAELDKARRKLLIIQKMGQLASDADRAELTALLPGSPSWTSCRLSTSFAT
jgi:hypothetical protein